MKIFPISANFFLLQQHYNYNNQNDFQFIQLFKDFTILNQIARFLEDDKINYLRHVDIDPTFYTTKECTMSRRSTIMIHGCPFPSSILSFMWGFFLSS